MSYNTKNYTEQGGEKTVIGGELVIEEGAKVTGLNAFAEISPATKTKLGGIKAGTKAETDTVEVKIGTDNKLYVPTYPVVEALPQLAKQDDSTADTVEALRADLNDLLLKLQTAGLMASE